MKRLLSTLLLFCPLFATLVRYHGGSLTGESKHIPEEFRRLSLRKYNVPPASGTYPRNK